MTKTRPKLNISHDMVYVMICWGEGNRRLQFTFCQFAKKQTFLETLKCLGRLAPIADRKRQNETPPAASTQKTGSVLCGLGLVITQSKDS